MHINSALYITTQLTGTRRYFSWCAHPNIWYSRLQKKIIDLGLKEKESIDFFVKFYPNDLLSNPNKEYIQSEHPAKALTQPLIEILTTYDFDLIITEAAATTLLEVLCTKSQILVYIPSDFIKLDREALSLLSRRAFVAESETDYIKLADILLSPKNTPKPKPINDDFLFKYAITSLEQDPCQLAVTNLNKVINEHSL